MKSTRFFIWMFFGLFLITAHISWAQDLKVYSNLRRQQTLQPGETYQGSILLENIADYPLVVKIFQEDYFFDVKQRQAINLHFQKERSNKSWITFKPDYLELLPHKKSTVDFMVTVPRSIPDRPLEGTYWSMLVIQPAPLEETDIPLTVIKGQKVYRQIQYGIQIVTHIANTGSKNLIVEDTWEQTDPDGNSHFYAVLRNTGTIGFRGETALELYNKQGEKVAKTSPVSTYIYPGCAVVQKINLPELQSDTYPSLLLVDGGKDALFGMQINIDLNSQQAMQ